MVRIFSGARSAVCRYKNSVGNPLDKPRPLSSVRVALDTEQQRRPREGFARTLRIFVSTLSPPRAGRGAWRAAVGPAGCGRWFLTVSPLWSAALSVTGVSAYGLCPTKCPHRSRLPRSPLGPTLSAVHVTDPAPFPVPWRVFVHASQPCPETDVFWALLFQPDQSLSL